MFMIDFRQAFPDLEFAARRTSSPRATTWSAAGRAAARTPVRLQRLPHRLATGRLRPQMRFTGTTVLRIENGKIAEEIGLDDGVTALDNSAS